MAVEWRFGECRYIRPSRYQVEIEIHCSEVSAATLERWKLKIEEEEEDESGNLFFHVLDAVNCSASDQIALTLFRLASERQ